MNSFEFMIAELKALSLPLQLTQEATEKYVEEKLLFGYKILNKEIKRF